MSRGFLSLNVSEGEGRFTVLRLQNEASINNKYGENNITTGVIATSRSDPSPRVQNALAHANVKQIRDIYEILNIVTYCNL